ncbi:MAG: pyridoxal phosphate-dependent aminotransferase [Planctomycetota bacterium]
MKISSPFAATAESPTLAITQKAAELSAAGRDIISLSAGEPDCSTPSAAAEAGIQAIRNGNTHYTPSAGIPELRDAICRSLERDFDLSYARHEVCATASTKPAIFLSLCAILEPGDEVVLMVPYWVSYPEMVRLAGGRTVLLSTREEDGFVPRLADLEACLARPRVRAILLNSPGNPAGAVWPKQRTHELVDLCRRHDCWILSDEIYAHILYGTARHLSPAAVEGGRERTVVLNGLSKAYSMTGWRIGFLAGPSELVASVIRVQSHLFGNPCTISQAAAEVALDEDGTACVTEMVAAFSKRRDFLLEQLSSIPELSLHAPEGAFYLFPGVKRLLDRTGGDDLRLAQRLLEEARIAVVPGSAFGAPGHIRLSFAASLEALEEAMRRLKQWLSQS